jgi:glycosyltransferase involved in cell wall biosynthesis
MPAAIEHLDLREYSLVLSSSSAISKGILTHPGQLHICYLQSRNLRYGYDERFLYSSAGALGLVQEILMSRARVWDYVAAHRPDCTIANSDFVKRWHSHRYGIEATVIYPPVNVDLFGREFRKQKGDYYVLVSRFEKYKRVPLVIQAFNRHGGRLLVVGSGSQDWQIRRIANANIEFLGVLPPHEVAKTVAGARASVYAGREDFGIALVEAQAAGTPVIAFQDGGADEIVRGLSDPSPTGVLFAEQTVDAIVSAIEVFETNENQISAEQCRANSLRFSADRFHKQFKSFVEQQWELFQHSH